MNGYKTRALYCSVKRVKYFSRIMLLSQAQMVLNSKYHVWGIILNQQHLDGWVIQEICGEIAINSLSNENKNTITNQPTTNIFVRLSFSTSYYTIHSFYAMLLVGWLDGCSATSSVYYTFLLWIIFVYKIYYVLGEIREIPNNKKRRMEAGWSYFPLISEEKIVGVNFSILRNYVVGKQISIGKSKLIGFQLL